MPYTNINDILNKNKFTFYMRNPFTGKLYIPNSNNSNNNLTEAQRTINNSIRRIQAAGYTPPPETQQTSALQTIANVLDFSGRATRSFLEKAFGIEGLTEGVGNALEQANILSNHPFLKGTVGFIGDILLDPLTYLSFGLTGIGENVAEGAVKTAAKEIASNVAQEGTEAIAKKAAQEVVEKAAQEAAKQGARRLAVNVSVPFLTKSAQIPIPGALSEAAASSIDDLTRTLAKAVEPVAAPLRNFFSRSGVSAYETPEVAARIRQAQERILNAERAEKGLGRMQYENMADIFQAIKNNSPIEQKMAAWLAEEGTSRGADQGARAAKKWLSVQPQEVQERVNQLVQAHKVLGPTMLELDKPLEEAGYKFGRVKNYIYHMYDNSPEEINQALKKWSAVLSQTQRLGGITTVNKGFMQPRNLDFYTAEQLGLKPVYDPVKLWGARIYQSARAHMGLEINKELKELADTGIGVIKVNKYNLDEVPKGWVEVSNIVPGFKDFIKRNVSREERKVAGTISYYVHPDLARTIRSLDKTFTDNVELANAASSLSKITTLWKSLVTTTPGYQVRNTLGNMLAMQQADIPFAQQPSLLYKALKTWNLPDDALVIAPSMVHPNGITKGEILQQFYRYNLFGHGGVEELNTLNAKMADIAQKTDLFDKGLALATKITMPSHKLSEAIETNFKMGMFLDKLQRGYSFEDAAGIVRKYLFDYNDITPAERAIRNIFPFYTYTRKELPILLENIITNPKIYIAQGYLEKEFQDAYGLQDKDLPDWLRAQLAIPIKVGNSYRMINLGLPTSMLGEIDVSKGAFGAAQDVARLGAGMINPLFRVPLEMASGTQLYSGMPIKTREYQMEGFRGLTSKVIPAELEYLLKQIPFPYTGGVEGPLGIMYNLGGNTPAQTQAESELPPREQPDALTVLLNTLGMSSMAPQISPERQRAIQDIIRRNQLVDFITMLRNDLGVNVPTINELNSTQKISLQQLLDEIRYNLQSIGKTSPQGLATQSSYRR